MENKKSYFAIIPANVRYDKNLNANAKLLYGEITALCNEKGFCWASNSYFADLYGVSIRTIRAWIKALVDNNYIQMKMIYKDGSKQIEKRVLTITPLEENFPTSGKKLQEGREENFPRGGEENFRENNTIYNNTINNTSNIYSDANASRESDKLSKEDEIVKEVIEYFNTKAGKKYQWNTKASSSHLRARIKEGFTIDDFKYVIDNQVELWKYDVRMAKFLRPMTLFSPEKFESYLNAPKAKADEWDLIINDETKQKDDYFYNFV